MDEYKRNNSMIACIILVVIVSATIVGIAALNEGFGFNLIGSYWDESTPFNWTKTNTSPPSLIAVNIHLDAGEVNVTFVDDPTLIADINMLVPNKTLAQRGEPTVVITGERITLSYDMAKVELILGNATKYSFDISVTTGTINTYLNESAMIGQSNFRTTTGTIDTKLDGTTISNNLTLSVVTGQINLSIKSNVKVQGNRTISASVVTGKVDVSVFQPENVGVIFTGSVDTGDVEVNTDTWNTVTSSVYKTQDYGYTVNSIALNISVNTGSIDAFLQ